MVLYSAANQVTLEKLHAQRINKLATSSKVIYTINVILDRRYKDA